MPVEFLIDQTGQYNRKTSCLLLLPDTWPLTDRRSLHDPSALLFVFPQQAVERGNCSIPV